MNTRRAGKTDAMTDAMNALWELGCQEGIAQGRALATAEIVADLRAFVSDYSEAYDVGPNPFSTGETLVAIIDELRTLAGRYERGEHVKGTP